MYFAAHRRSVMHAEDVKVEMPFDGETFSSWLYRLAVYNVLPGLGVDTLNDLFALSVSKGSFDPDFDPSCVFSVMGRDLSKCSNALFHDFFSPLPSWITPRFYRRSYCYECFCEQIPLSGHPAVMKCWAVTYNAICSKHKSVLQDGDFGIQRRLAVGSSLFCSHHDLWANSCPVAIPDEEFEAVNSTQHSLQVAEERLYFGDRSYLHFHYFCRLFLEVMLYPDFGFCSRLFQRKKSNYADLLFWKKLRMGPYLASSQQRHAAVLLLGWILGLGATPERLLATLNVENFFDLGKLSNVTGNRELHSLISSICWHMQQPGVIDFVRGYCREQRSRS